MINEVIEKEYAFLPKNIKKAVETIDISKCYLNNNINFLKLWNLISDKLRPYLFREKYFNEHGQNYCGVEYDDLLEVFNDSILENLLVCICTQNLKSNDLSEYYEKCYRYINTSGEDDESYNHFFKTVIPNIIDRTKEGGKEFNNEDIHLLLTAQSPLAGYYILEYLGCKVNKCINVLPHIRFREKIIEAIERISEQNIDLESMNYLVTNKKVTRLLDSIEYEKITRLSFYVEMCKLYEKFVVLNKNSESQFGDYLAILSFLQDLSDAFYGSDIISNISDYIIKYDPNEAYKRLQTFMRYLHDVVYKILKVVYTKLICTLVPDDTNLSRQISEKLNKNNDYIDRVKNGLASIKDFFYSNKSSDIQYDNIPITIDINIRSLLKCNFDSCLEIMYSRQSTKITFNNCEYLNSYIISLDEVCSMVTLANDKDKNKSFFENFPNNVIFAEYSDLTYKEPI